MIRILFLSANPNDQGELAVIEECKPIEFIFTVIAQPMKRF